MMAEVAGGAQGSVVMAALHGNPARVPDATQRAAVRRRAGTQLLAAFCMGPGSAERHFVPHRVRGTRAEYVARYISSRPSSNGSSPPARFFFFDRCQTTPGNPFSGTSGSPV